MESKSISRRELLRRGTVTTIGIAATSLTTAYAKDGTKRGNMEVSNSLLATLRPEHPRLIATKTTWEAIKTRRRNDTLLDAFLKRSEVEARAILPAAPVVYKKDGKRLLNISRVTLRRVILLSLNYHLTGDIAFAQRAEAEMLATAAFTDWNPSHFLDVGEMTAALALGYDWLYDQLSKTGRTTIETAIVEKGLKPGLEGTPGWLTVENNWNQVCLGGLSLGALAIAEKEPDLAIRILERTRANNHNGQKPYAPDGVYPEGAMYWGYGTTYEAVLLAGLQTALGTDFGLSQSKGFLESGTALVHQLGPTGMFFNFSDNQERPTTESGMWWFAQKRNQPGLLRYDLAHIKEYTASTRPPNPATQADRLLPLAAIWWPTDLRAKNNTLPKNWYGRGPNQLATFRTDWDNPRASYLALKAGGAPLSHAHMDAGSFVYEANGVRWACDLGMQDYLSLESKGIDLWGKAQTAGRWKVYRLGPFAHNTLTINHELHRADGLAAITHFSDGSNAGAIVDLSAVFKGQATRVTRGFLFQNGSTLIRDELEGLKSGDTVRWAMLTRAEVTLESDKKQVVLRQGKETLHVRLDAPSGALFEVVSADPPESYDAPNPGLRLLTATIAAPASGSLAWTVTLEPSGETKASKNPASVPLTQWTLPPVK